MSWKVAMMLLSSLTSQAQGVHPKASGAMTEKSLGNRTITVVALPLDSSGSLWGLNSEKAVALRSGRGITRKNIGLGCGTRGKA